MAIMAASSDLARSTAAPEAPSGMVALVFTDIEGSTELWERHGAAAGAVVDEHNRLLRACAADCGGVEVKAIGDAFFLAFPHARHALRFALCAQVALGRHAWHAHVGANEGASEVPTPHAPHAPHAPPVLPVLPVLELRVRIGIHVGEAHPMRHPDGALDYLSPATNRASRVAAAAHGGQVLLSEAARLQVQGELPAEVSLRDLGLFTLKGLGEERLWQAEHAATRRDFAPPNAPRAARHNLPPVSSPLIGRETEVSCALAALRDPSVRLLSLLGPGGTGKTRLSLEVAAHIAPEYEDGVCFVVLSPVRDPELVAQAMGRALELPEVAGQTPEQTVRAHLAERHLLLLLDNFEQVVGAAPVVGRLLATCPRLQVLVTSRAPLHLRGEHPFIVPPLLLPLASEGGAVEESAAVRLFVERAQVARPGFSLSPENAGAVAEICRRLDGLPLAIELAAARTRFLPPPVLLHRMQSRLKLLTGGARDLPERHQTLRSAIDWSHSLLEEGETLFFRRAAVFAGGATLPALEHVCGCGFEGASTSASTSIDSTPEGTECDVLECASSLVDKSLLRSQETLRDDGGAEGEDGLRFGMLETIREFGLERLEQSGEENELRRRHARYFAALTQEAYSHMEKPFSRERMRWWDAMHDEHDNVRAALAWGLEHDLQTACELISSWSFGPMFERGPAADRALELLAAPSSNPAREIEPRQKRILYSAVLGVAAEYAAWHGDLDRQKLLAQQRLELLQHVVGEADAKDVPGTDAPPPNAREPLLPSDSQEAQHEAWALFSLGLNAWMAGENAAAQEHFGRALPLFRAGSNWVGVTSALSWLGASLVDQRRFEEARTTFVESQRVFESVGDRDGVAGMLANLADVARAEGNFARARELFEQSEQIERELGDKRGHPWRRYQKGRLHGAVGEHASAEVLLKRALRGFKEGSGVSPHSHMGSLRCVVALAWNAAALGQHERSAILFAAQQAQRAAQHLPPPVGWGEDLAQSQKMCRESLGDSACEAAQEKGRAMSWTEMTAFALADANT